MKLRRLMCMLMACALMLGSVIPPVRAADAPDKSVVWLEDLDWEWIDLSTVNWQQEDIALQTICSIDEDIPRTSIYVVTQFLDLRANDVVTFNCSYSPSSASVDFGVITSDGGFYSINVKGGSISRSIGINQAGSYAVAVRNNSSQTVRVVGFVNY